MASSCGLCAHPGTLFCKGLKQMSMINFMSYSLSRAAEGFVPSHAPLKNNKHLNIHFQSTQPRKGKNKSGLQGLTPSSLVRACIMRRGGWGRASILSVVPNVAPNNLSFKSLFMSKSRVRSKSTVSCEVNPVKSKAPLSIWPLCLLMKLSFLILCCISVDFFCYNLSIL